MLLEKGGIIALLNLLIESRFTGGPTPCAFATLNAAIRLQRHDLGLIAPTARATWWCLIPWRNWWPVKSTLEGNGWPMPAAC